MPTFTTTLQKDDEKNATGIRVPPDVVTALGSGKKPAVTVTISSGQAAQSATYTYRSTVAGYGDVSMLPFSKEHRDASGIAPGDSIEVTVELDMQPRTVDVPDDLATALATKSGAREAFDKLSYSARKEHVRQVESAKTQETRERRLASIVAKLGE